MDGNIIIGRYGLNREILEECKTLKAAKEAFKKMPENVVRQAFYQVHPKKKKSTNND